LEETEVATLDTSIPVSQTQVISIDVLKKLFKKDFQGNDVTSAIEVLDTIAPPDNKDDNGTDKGDKVCEMKASPSSLFPKMKSRRKKKRSKRETKRLRKLFLSLPRFHRNALSVCVLCGPSRSRLLLGGWENSNRSLRLLPSVGVVTCDSTFSAWTLAVFSALDTCAGQTLRIIRRMCPLCAMFNVGEQMDGTSWTPQCLN